MRQQVNYIHKWFLAVCVMFFCMQALPAYATQPLAPEKAFQFSLVVDSAKQATITWQISKGYYLYRDRIHLKSANDHVEYTLPQANKELKGLAVYQDKLVLPVKLTAAQNHAQLLIRYQGCAEDGFCYPYISKHLNINLQTGSVSDYKPFSLKGLLTNQNDIQDLFSGSSMTLTLAIFFVLGLLLALTPCVLPMVPILTGIIVGHQGVVTTKKAFLLSLAYVLGMAITYAAAGMLAVVFGNSLQVWFQQPVFLAFAAGVLVVLAFSLLGVYQLHFSHHWQNLVTNWSNYHQGGNYAGVFCMGVLSTLIVSPCVTAPMIGILMYVAQSGNLWVGGGSLFVLGLGMGVPLLLVGVSAGRWLPKAGAWMEAIKKLFGVLMLAMAVWLISRVLSPEWTTLLWGLVALTGAYLLAVSFPRLLGRPLIYRMISMLLVVTSAYFIFTIMYLPGSGMQSAQMAQNNHAGFTVVKSQADLEAKLALAKAHHRPVMLDFYADWCESCVSMDKHVLNKPAVQQLMKGFDLLRVDLSNNSANDASIMRQFNVIAPPTVLFFNINGKEVNTRRIVGEMSEEQFASKLNMFFVQGCDLQQYC